MKSHEPFDTIDIQKKSAMICRFMGGKIVPSNIPNSVAKTWQECEVTDVNGIDPDYSMLTFHSNWNHIMQVWQKIISLDKSGDTTYPRKGNIYIGRLEVTKYSLLLTCRKWVSRKIGWNNINIYHYYAKEFGYNEPDCVDMKQVYYKTIIDFINWYNEKPK